MKKLRIILLILAFIVSCVGTVCAENPAKIEFRASQSYELADLIETFASYQKENSSIIGRSMPLNLDYLYSINKQYLGVGNAENIRPNDYYGGYIGILFMGNGYKKNVQSFDKGFLKNENIDMGYTADLTFICPVYWGFNSMQIGLMSPPILQRLLGMGEKYTKNLDLTPYFVRQKFQIKKLYENGYICSGKVLWKLTTKTKKTVYVVCTTSCGASGLIGSTALRIYFDYKNALNDFNTYKIYN